MSCRLPSSGLDRRRIVLQHFSLAPLPQPFRHPFHIMACGPTSKLFRYELECTLVHGFSGSPHAILQAANLVLAGFDEFVQVQLAIVEGAVATENGLSSKRAGIANTIFLRITVVVLVVVVAAVVDRCGSGPFGVCGRIVRMIFALLIIALRQLLL